MNSLSSRREVDVVEVLLNEHVDHVGCTHIHTDAYVHSNTIQNLESYPDCPTTA